MTTAYATAYRRRRPTGAPVALPWVFAVATVLAQICYPLLDGEPLRIITIATVVLFFCASVSHAAVHRGAAWALGLVVIAGGGGLLAEAVGVRTGYPFGTYAYADTLGPKLAGVPVIVPLAWTMMAYPTLIAARRLSRRWAPLVGGFALASWDLFLDPQMVAAGHWTWSDPTPGIPRIPGIPLTNYAGWLLVAVVMMTLLTVLLPERPHADDALPAALLLWTWVASIVGNIVFFDRPAVGVIGGVVMGLVVVPYAYALWLDRA